MPSAPWLVAVSVARKKKRDVKQLPHNDSLVCNKKVAIGGRHRLRVCMVGYALGKFLNTQNALGLISFSFLFSFKRAFWEAKWG